MKKIVVFVLSLFIFNFVNAESDKALFSKCVDGDTAYFLVNENEIKVRFLAIDTPESVSTNVSEQPFGKEASDYTCNKISNADEIVLEYEKNKTDKYGRKTLETAPYLENRSMGNYIKSAHYADQALGEFIEELQKENLLENTIIVFYGDHEARLSKKEFNLLYNYDPETNGILDEDDPNYVSMENYNYDLLKNTPLIIWSNEESYNKEITSVMGMYDVLPTIANMFGFEEKYALGHDIFSNNEHIVVFPNGNILTDKVYYSDSNEEYIMTSNEPIDTEYIDRIKDYADKVLTVSNGIIKYDLIKYESDKIGECKK